MFTIYNLVAVAIIALISMQYVNGHGMMLDPVGRASRWREDSSAPANYDDSGLFCGGFAVHQYENDGKCGLCGDNYKMATPRPNELGGKFGSGVIVKTYKNTNKIYIGSMITANHLGYIAYDLCNIDESGKETEECFAKNTLSFIDGYEKYNIYSRTGWVNTTVGLPKNFNCKHCVLRWTYTAGNNWGTCSDGTGAMGCGKQETFRSCADISILNSNSKSVLDEIPDEVL